MTASKQHLPCDASFFSGDHSFAAFWVAAAARRATLLAVVAHLHRGNVNDRRVLPAFRTRSPRESSLKAGLRIGHVHSPFCAGFSNRSRNRWTSDSVRPTSPFFILTAQSVPSRTKRRSVERGMPRRLAAWLPVKILSAGSVVSGGGNLLPFRRRVVPAGLGRARRPDSQSLDTLYAGRSGTEMQAVLSLAAGWCCFWRN